MKNWQRSSRIVLLVTLLLGAAAALSPSAMSAYIHPDSSSLSPPRSMVQHPDGGLEEWLMTPEAQARTLAGECQANWECLELCISSVPMGEFQCWPEGAW